ncbi:MAG: hypothetical protein ACRDP7_35720 [Trebonia sp.]
MTYDSTQSLLAAIAPGMDLCTSDFTGWTVVEGVQPGRDGQPGFIVGRKHVDNCVVHVPPEAVIAIHGGHCVRIDRARATGEACGHVLAETVLAGEAVPRFANSAMDGYAVRTADVTGIPVRLRVTGTVAA